ncbi:hypothetical protein PIB30_082705, partial [Stylosanthes scabra]|nr:hypothetical protein [Stylosanthes scabra]
SVGLQEGRTISVSLRNGGRLDLQGHFNAQVSGVCECDTICYYLSKISGCGYLTDKIVTSVATITNNNSNNTLSSHLLRLSHLPSTNYLPPSGKTYCHFNRDIPFGFSTTLQSSPSQESGCWSSADPNMGRPRQILNPESGSPILLRSKHFCSIALWAKMDLSPTRGGPPVTPNHSSSKALLGFRQVASVTSKSSTSAQPQRPPDPSSSDTLGLVQSLKHLSIPVPHLVRGLRYLRNIGTVCGDTHSALAMADHQQEFTNTNPPPVAGREKVPPKTSNQPWNTGRGDMEDEDEANVTGDEENAINSGNQVGPKIGTSVRRYPILQYLIPRKANWYLSSP